MRASEVFDAKLIGSYIAISEIFGAIHPLIFHNFLFYYNPESGLLEPIAYDASFIKGTHTVVRLQLLLMVL